MNASGERRVELLDDTVDHVRGPSDGPLVLEYGDYECPYSRRAFLEIERIEQEWSAGPLVRIRRDVESGTASGEVLGTPTLFIDGVVYRGGYDAASLEDALAV